MIKLKDFFQKQKMMTKVLISLLPILLLSVYFFGLRMLVLLSVVTVTGRITSYNVCYTKLLRINQASAD